MPFGLRNASQTFQRFMNRVCLGLDFVLVYIDDLLIVSKSHEDHKNHLKIILERLVEYGLNVNSSKCVFGADKLEFLSHKVTKDGIYPSNERIEAIENYPTPCSVKQIQRFVGMINYYHRFVPKLAETLAPIHSHLATLVRKLKPQFSWPDICQQMLLKCKADLINATLLVYPVHNASYSSTTDGSNIAVGAVL